MTVAIAHRGSRILWPENTMTAFRGAVDLGYRWLETDLHATSDGVLVCIHDDTVDRTTDGSGPASEKTLAEIQSLDAGYRHRSSGEWRFRGSGVRIPTLEEVASSFEGASLVVDLKQDGLEALLVDLVDRLGLWDRLVVGSFSDERLARFRTLSGGRVRTSTGPGETLKAWRRAWVGTPERFADAVRVPRTHFGFPVVTRRTVAGFHRGGYQVHVWTVNSEKWMNRLLDWEVDGIITDRPDLLRSVLERRSLWSSQNFS